LAWGIGEVSVRDINSKGLGPASRMAFRRAVKGCNLRLASQGLTLEGKLATTKRVDYLLLDAFYLPYTKGIKRKNQLAIIKGDSKSYSIAAASIIAKVYRDKLMQELSKKYPKYGWGRNKGYGTKEHSDAILKDGTTRLHRKMFVRKLVAGS
jgi:ribonuclease HII